MLFLSLFEGLHFCPAALMEAFTEKVIANPDALTLKDLLCILKVYSSLNYDLQDQRQQYVTRLCSQWISMFLSFFLFLFPLPSSSLFSSSFSPVSYSSFSSIIFIISVCNLYRFLDSLSQVLDSYLPKMSAYELSKAVYCLCQLGHFPSAPLEQLLQSSTLEQLAGKTTNTLMLMHRLAALHP